MIRTIKEAENDGCKACDSIRKYKNNVKRQFYCKSFKMSF